MSRRLVITAELTDRAAQLSRSNYRPQPIRDLAQEIEGEIRAAELAHSITGLVDHEKVAKIIDMKHQLDCLYMDWIEGKIK